MGTEIEFGIMVKNDPDFDPISSCVLIVNAYREDPDGKILWDYDQENPLADARGFQVEGEKYTPNQQENIARNKTLINGARYYVDHAHPEYSCPEVTNARDLVIHEITRISHLRWSGSVSLEPFVEPGRVGGLRGGIAEHRPADSTGRFDGWSTI